MFRLVFYKGALFRLFRRSLNLSVALMACGCFVKVYISLQPFKSARSSDGGALAEGAPLEAQHRAQLMLRSCITGRDRAGSGSQLFGTSGGVGFPPTRHLNWAAVHQLLPHSAPCRHRKSSSPVAALSAPIFASKNDTNNCRPRRGLGCFHGEKSGRGWTITLVDSSSVHRSWDSSAGSWTILNSGNVMLFPSKRI